MFLLKLFLNLDNFEKTNKKIEEEIVEVKKLKFEENAFGIKRSNVNNSVKYKNFLIDKLKVLKILYNQKNIIKNIKCEIKHNKKELCYQYIENEQELYEIYGNNNLKIDKNNIDLHTDNAMFLDFINLTKKILKILSVESYLFILLILSYLIFIIPYFLQFNFPLNFDFKTLSYSVIIAIGIGILCFIYIFLISSFSNVLYFKFAPKNGKKWMLNFSFIVLLACIMLPISFYNLYNLLNSNDIFIKIFECYVDSFSYITFALITIYFISFLIYFMRNNANDIANKITTVFVIIVLDILLLCIIYRYLSKINFIIVLVFLILYFLPRIIMHKLNVLKYKHVFIISTILTFIIILFFSYNGVFVGIGKIANYQTDIVIDKKTIPKKYTDSNLTDCNTAKDFFPIILV